jgi:biofilm PGA synthesis lipoprotein PgaB
VTFGLGVALNERVEPRALRREVVTSNPDLRAFTSSLLYPPSPPILRAAQVDLDYVYDSDPVQQEANLDALVERIHRLEISHVFLQAFADPDADGGAAAVYFPTDRIAVRADLFNRAAWQLRTRAQVRVFAWLPMLSYSSPAVDPGWRVLEEVDGARAVDEAAEPRLSPFNAAARAYIASIYRDLAAHATFDGILFHDDGRLNEREDASAAALDAYRAAFGPEFSLDKARTDPALGAAWTRMKSAALIDFSAELERVVRRYRPEIETARNLFATAVLDPQGERYLAQNLTDYLDAYDYVALMAMPGLERAELERPFYASLIAAVASRPTGLARTLFELQTVDWRSQRPIAGTDLRDTMRWLQSLGVRHLGYYPDDFISNRPDLGALRQGMSLARFPGVVR